MGLGEEGWLSVVAIVLTVLSILWQFYLERQRRKERRLDEETRATEALAEKDARDAERLANRKDRENERQREVEIDYENIGGAFMLQKLYDYRTRIQKLHGAQMSYAEDFHVNHPQDIDQARSTLKKFWERTIRSFEAGLLPDHFLGAGDWLQYGHNYRVVAEPIDIANFYRLSGVWEQSGHYLAGNNRPHPYVVLEVKWSQVYGEAEDSVSFAREMRERVDPKQA